MSGGVIAVAQFHLLAGRVSALPSTPDREGMAEKDSTMELPDQDPDDKGSVMSHNPEQKECGEISPSAHFR